MDTLIADLRYAVRSLLKAPGFTLVAVLTLALGIGATTTVFTLVEGVLLRSLPFPEADRLVDVKQAQAPWSGIFHATSPLSAVERWSAAPGTFDAAAAYSGQSAIFVGTGPAERVMAWTVSAGFFPLLGARPALGRGFDQEDDRPGAPPVAVLSHEFWAKRLAGDPAALGRTITLDTTAYAVVGVMPAGFRYPASAQLWTNLGARLAGPQGAARAREFTFWMVGRLAPRVGAGDAQRRLDVVNRRAWSTDPDARPWLPVVTPLRDMLTGEVRTPLLVLLGAVALVLLVACSNVASLMLARASARQHLVAMRAALGAGRGRLVRGPLVEALVLAAAGAALGLAAAAWCVPPLVALAGADLPRAAGIALDGGVVAACAGAAVLATLLTAAAPAWRAARLHPAEVLQAGGHGRATSRGRLGGALIVVQLALTTVLLAAAALFTRSFVGLTRVDPGFEPRHVLVADLDLPGARYTRGEQRIAYVNRALEAVGAVPGVTAAAAATGIPLAPGAINVVDRPGDGDGARRSVELFIAAVTPGYFRTLGIPLLRGRELASVDPDAVVIDAVTAREFFPGQDPIGRRFTMYGTVTRTVVGVVGTVRQEMLPVPAPMSVYTAYGTDPSGWLHVLAVTKGDPARSLAAVRRAIEDVDRDVPVDKVEPMTARMAEAIAQQRFYALALGAFGLAALLLSAVGVYGLVSYTVSRRTREFGIRIALGAEAGSVVRLVVGRGLVMATAGVVLGLAGALALTRALQSLLVGIASSDPAALAGAGLVLFAVALTASWLPARRAARVDPMEALRAE